MKALLAKIPRDRSLLLLLAPALVLVAFLAAGRSEVDYSALPVGVIATSSTTTTTAAPFTAEGAAEQSAEVEGSSVGRSGTTSGSGSGGSASSGAAGRTSSGSGSSGTGSGSSATSPSTPDWVDGATSTTNPGATTSTTPSPTTTLPGGGGPDPVVDEVPVAILLPVTAVLVLCLALFVISRRRRVRGA